MLFSERQGLIAIARLDKGDGKNALTREILEAIRDGVNGFAAEPEPPTAFVYTGTHEVFSVGVDLKDPKLGHIETASVPDRLAGPRLGAAACTAIAECPSYTIAAVEGWCLGGGLALVGSADLVIAGASAKFGLPEVDRGMNLSWTALPRLISRAGPVAAKRLAILGEFVSAVEAKDLGIADEVVPAGSAYERALELARLAAAKPPLAVRAIKRGANAYTEGLIRTASALDAEQFALLTFSADFSESIDAFKTKRPPEFEGR